MQLTKHHALGNDFLVTFVDEVPADAPLIWVDTYWDERPEGAAEINDAIERAVEARGNAAVAHWTEIASIDGVDCLWVGHFDLSNSLGIPGQFGHPEFLKATDAVIAAARRHGKSAGRLVPTVDESIKLYKDGFDFISYSGDVWAFMGAVQTAVNDIRDGCKTVSKKRATASKKAASKTAKKKS